MATRAEQFRYWQERSGPKKPPQAKRRDWPGRSGLPVRPSDERIRHGRTASRNWSLHGSKEGPYALEDSPSGKASRKSTRRSSGRIKSSHVLRSRTAVLGRLGT